MDQSHWPPLLKVLKIKFQLPRTLPSEYSIVIRQFHKNWIEREVEQEMRTDYPSLVKLTRMFVKGDTPLNLVRADFHSISQVKQLLLKQVRKTTKGSLCIVIQFSDTVGCFRRSSLKMLLWVVLRETNFRTSDKLIFILFFSLTK